MKKRVLGRREELRKRTKRRNPGGFYNPEHELTWEQRRLFQAYDDLFEHPDLENVYDVKRVQIGEDGIADVMEKGSRYRILSYSFNNPADELQRVEIEPGSLVVLANDEHGECNAEVESLFFYNDEEENICIEATFNSTASEDISDWASLESIVFVFPPEDTE